MVTFLPFPGYRPSLTGGESIEDRISPPYDVINNDYLKELQSHKNNVTNLTLKPDTDKRYHESRKELDRMISEGSLRQDTDSFYLYEQTFSEGEITRIRTGLVGILKTEEYSEGNIIPHEETFSKVKEDRLNLLRDVETHLESIFGIFEGLTPELNKKIKNLSKLVYRYKDEQNVEHRYSRIADPDIIEEIVKQIEPQKMLIADGHHRYETALNYSKENPDNKKKGYVLTTMVASNDEGLVIWPTHRMVSSDILEKDALPKLHDKLILKKVSPEELEVELNEWMMGLIFESGKCFLAKSKTEKDSMWNLDTYVAQELILKEIYGYDKNISTVAYDAELSSVKEKMKQKEYCLAIVFNDPDLQDIWNLSAIGKRMPKKTTYFFPKIWSGFVLYNMS